MAMCRKAIAAALFMMFASTAILSAVGEPDIQLDYDLDLDDGGFTHSGMMDVWQWGTPGGGEPGNPGPTGPAEGDGCWGAPLNSSYKMGSDCYLTLPVVDGSDLQSLSLSFLCWYDLTYYDPDDESEAGTAHTGDVCTLEISQEGSIWRIVETYSNDTNFLWVMEEFDLSDHLGEEVHIRFHLKDNGDGFEDNGFFLDSLSIEGVQKPAISISMEPLNLPGIAPLGERCRFDVITLNQGLTFPDDTFLNISMMGPLGDEMISDIIILEGKEREAHEVIFTPVVEGNYSVEISLFISGDMAGEDSGSIWSRKTVFLEDVDSMYGWSMNHTGEVGWNVHDLSVKPPTPSGNSVFWFGRSEGWNGGPGFEGAGDSILESDWIDLQEMRSAELYMYHSYDLKGPEGSCGGRVLALQGNTWEVITPGRGYDINMLGGTEDDSFSGSMDWTMVRFDLEEYLGNYVKIRFLGSSNEDGRGVGWFIDDIMVIGKEIDRPDTDPPASIEGLRVSLVDEGEVSVEWYPSAAVDFDHYNIYLESGYFASTAGLSPYSVIDSRDWTTFLVSDLEPFATYWLVIAAVDTSGNERRAVDPFSFEPTDEENTAPVAIIDVEGSSLRAKGDIITLTGADSYDPDGDSLNYSWSLPDGSTMTGVTITWKPARTGELRIELAVEDGRGLSAKDTIKFIISDPSDDPRADVLSISDYLKIILPLFLVFLLILAAVTFMGKSRKRRIERKLERAGIDCRDRQQYWSGGSRTVQAEEVDLVPILSRSEKTCEDESPRTVPGEPPKPWTAPPPPRRKKEDRPKGRPSPTMKKVGVVLECPTCMETFRMRVSKRALDRGDDIELMCPHCGYEGNIND